MRALLIVLLSTAMLAQSTVPMPGHKSHKKAVLVGIVAGAAAGIAIGFVTRSSCPNKIDGVPYSGTPPCPKYWPDPTSRRRK